MDIDAGGHLRPVRGHRSGVAQECVETKDRPAHLEDHFYPRSSTRSDGRVWAGQARELVLPTSLTKQGSRCPATAPDLTACCLGTARPAFRRMEKVTGRSDT